MRQIEKYAKFFKNASEILISLAKCLNALKELVALVKPFVNSIV